MLLINSGAVRGDLLIVQSDLKIEITILNFCIYVGLVTIEIYCKTLKKEIVLLALVMQSFPHLLLFCESLVLRLKLEGQLTVLVVQTVLF